MTAPIRLRDPHASGKMYSFNLSFGEMAVLLTAMALALTLFFILGVMVGQGHRPEAAVPVVAGIMPKDPMSRPAPSEKVLSPEDLGYPDQLNHRTPAPVRAADDGSNATAKAESATAAKPADKSETKSKPEAKPEAKVKIKPEAKTETKIETKAEAKRDERSKADRKAAELADQKAADKAKDQKAIRAEADKAAKKARDERPPDPDTQRYDYSYQVASFPSTDEAKAYLKRVKGLGIKGDIESGVSAGKPWYRVVVFFRGTPTDTRGLKAKLGTLGAQKFVMRSKDPI